MCISKPLILNLKFYIKTYKQQIIFYFKYLFNLIKIVINKFRVCTFVPRSTGEESDEDLSVLGLCSACFHLMLLISASELMSDLNAYIAINMFLILLFWCANTEQDPQHEENSVCSRSDFNFSLFLWSLKSFLFIFMNSMLIITELEEY